MKTYVDASLCPQKLNTIVKTRYIISILSFSSSCEIFKYFTKCKLLITKLTYIGKHNNHVVGSVATPKPLSFVIAGKLGC
jgi:hypothetical protein